MTTATPTEIAGIFRARFATMIPKTWPDYFAAGQWLTACEFAQMIQEQVDCDFADAAAAVAEVVPELLAGYWDSRQHLFEAEMGGSEQ